MKVGQRLLTLATAILAVAGDQPGFRVGGLALERVESFGHCPTRMHFVGVVNGQGSGDVTYQWVRSDKVSSAPRTLHFDQTGSLKIMNDWTLNTTMRGWMAFKILSPGHFQSNKLEFHTNCP